MGCENRVSFVLIFSLSGLPHCRQRSCHSHIYFSRHTPWGFYYYEPVDLWIVRKGYQQKNYPKRAHWNKSLLQAALYFVSWLQRDVWLHEMPEVQFISPFLEYLSRFKFRFGTVGLLEFLRCRSSSVFLLKNKPAKESSELRHYLNVCREVIWSSHITSISDKTKRSYCQHKRRPRGARTATLQLSLSLKLDVEITSWVELLN